MPGAPRAEAEVLALRLRRPKGCGVATVMIERMKGPPIEAALFCL